VTSSLDRFSINEGYIGLVCRHSIGNNIISTCSGPEVEMLLPTYQCNQFWSDRNSWIFQFLSTIV